MKQRISTCLFAFIGVFFALITISAAEFLLASEQVSIFVPVVFKNYSSDEPLRLIMLTKAEERGAVCNDGSPPAYYLRTGVDEGSRRWIIHLQGGGFCYSEGTCEERMALAPNLMTSMGLPATRDGNGILAADPSMNPVFNNANQVFVHYCSSDLWSGDRAASPETGGLHFRGASIVRAVIEDLADPSITPEPNLADATQVLFSGTSAGGAGVLVHLDWLAEQFPKAKVYGVNDAGWFIDIEPFDPAVVSPREAGQLAYAYWNGTVDASCAAANAGTEGLCYLGEYAYPYISTPLFVQIAQFDDTQLISLGLVLPIDEDIDINDDELSYALQFGSAIRDSLGPVSGAFSPADQTHGLLTNEKFWSVRIEGYSLQEVLFNWVFDQSGPVKLVEEPTGQLR